jgi:nucleoside-diphosphate-sugar epimerase
MHFPHPAFLFFSIFVLSLLIDRILRPMSGFTKVAVLGASGLLGKPVVKQLANAGFELTLIGRDASKVKSAFPGLSNAKFVQAESTDASALKEAFSGTNRYLESNIRR